MKGVHTKSGADLGLPGTRLFPGQVISAPFERRRAPARAIRVRAGRKAVQQGDGAPRLVGR